MSSGLPEAPSLPIPIFDDWMRLAVESEHNDPNAAALATADAKGRPSVRMVLVKHWDLEGFRFFTNSISQKGRELAQNPWASLCFHWKSLRRQVRVEGQVTQLASEKVDEYFHSRSRRSQIAAAVSRQSTVLPSRAVLENAFDEFAATHPGTEIPRPPTWIGFTLSPVKIEFWSDGADRLHHRLLFLRHGDSWQSSLLYP